MAPGWDTRYPPLPLLWAPSGPQVSPLCCKQARLARGWGRGSSGVTPLTKRKMVRVCGSVWKVHCPPPARTPTALHSPDPVPQERAQGGNREGISLVPLRPTIPLSLSFLICEMEMM